MHKELEYYIGKVCSIFTTNINRQFDEEANLAYFVGIVRSIDNLGVSIQSPLDSTRSFFFFNHIVGIAEEETFDPENPDDVARLKTLMENKETVFTPKASQPAPPPQVFEDSVSNSPFLDITALENIAQQAKAMYHNQR